MNSDERDFIMNKVNLLLLLITLYLYFVVNVLCVTLLNVLG